jgi:O-antigen/teichoic acid export membrane protein
MILGLQQGLFLLGVLGNDQDAGVFGFSLTLGMGFFAVYLAFYQTILPRAARIASIDAVPRFLGKTYAMAIALVCVCIPLAWAIGAFLPVALEAWKPDKPELAEFAPSFYYYAAFTMFLVLEAPLAVTCHYLLRPQIQLAAMVIRCAAIGALGVWLVPAGGAVAAGQAQAGGAAIAFACLAAFVGLSLRSARRRSRCAAS